MGIGEPSPLVQTDTPDCNLALGRNGIHLDGYGYVQRTLHSARLQNHERAEPPLQCPRRFVQDNELRCPDTSTGRSSDQLPQ